MKKFIQIFLTLFVLVIALPLFLSCKKTRAFNSEDCQTAGDVNFIRNETDEIITDVQNVLSEQFLTRGKLTEVNTYSTCYYSEDTSNVFSGVISLSYLTSTCQTTKKEGMVIITVQNYPLSKWSKKNCSVKIDLIDYKVTRSTSSANIKMNGTLYLTNQSGGTWYELKFLNVPNLVHTLSGNDMVVFINGGGTPTKVNVSRTLNYTYKNKTVWCESTGNSSQNSKDNVEYWGDSRNKNFFSSNTVSNILSNSTCGAAYPQNGEFRINEDKKEFELKCILGIDIGGNTYDPWQITCPYGWKVSWSLRSKTNTKQFQYN